MAKRGSVDAIVDAIVHSVNNRGIESGNGFVRNIGVEHDQRGVGYQNQYGTSYVELITQIYQMINSGASLEDVIKQMSVLGDPMNGGQVDDLNKQLLDQALNLASTKENRAYNEQLRDEQRLYDNPQNQLARLMGAGISRDAAIAMLSGGSGSGGAGVPYSDPAAAAATAIPATQSTLNNAQTAKAYADIGFGVFNTIANMAGAVGALGSFGVSAAQLSTNIAATKAATAGQLLTNTSMKKTLQGIETASTVVGAISSAVDAGIIDKDHEFSSAQDMISTIRDNADKYEPFGALVKSGALDGINKDVYSLNALNGAYKSWRESRDYGIDRKHIVKMQALDELFKSTDIAKVNSEIAVNHQRIAESIANVLNSTKLANSTVELNKALGVQAYANASNLDALTDLSTQQYEMQQYDLDWLSANIDDINSIRTTQIQLDLSCWQGMTEDQIKEEAKSWLKDRQNQRSIIAIESYYYSGRLGAIEDRQNAIPNSDQDFAQWIVYMHNLFNNSLPAVPRSHKSDDLLGGLAGSAAARYLLKAAKYAL